MELAKIPSPTISVINLGPLTIHFYALCIIAGIVVAVWWGERRFVALGGAPGVVTDVAYWAVPSGIIGGRLYHLATTWESNRTFLDVIAIWRGGLGIWGQSASARSVRIFATDSSFDLRAATMALRSPSEFSWMPLPQESWLPKRLVAGVIGLTSNSLASQPHCLGGWRFPSINVRWVMRVSQVSIQLFSTNLSGAFWSRRSCSGSARAESYEVAVSSSATSPPTLLAVLD